MSLRVWLPLNGNTNNQGLSSITMSGSPNSYIATGKIGKCASFAGNTANIIYYNTSEFNYTDNFSYCVWINQNFTGTAQQWAFANGRADYGSYGYGIKINSATDISCFFGSKGVGVSCPTNEWHHIAVTISGTVMKVYKDGILDSTNSTATLPTYSDGNGFGLGCIHYTGGNIFPFYGSLNDFRIYDHCLSAKEVKEISKGLCLHYQLNSSYIEDTVNINSYIEQGISDTCFNNITQKYGYGTNTDMYKTIGDFQGRKCTKVYMGTADQDAWPFVHFRNIHPSNGAYKTLSFDYYPTSQDKINFYTYRGTATLTSSVNGTQLNTNTMSVKLNQWNHIIVTLLGTSDSTDGWGYMRIGTSKHTSTTSDYWLFANVQIEEKDHATIYTESSRSEITIFDCSGFNYSGTKSGTITWSNNSPRYSGSYRIDSTSTKIKAGAFNMTGFANSYTFSWWEKNSGTYNMPWGFSDGNRLNLFHSANLCWNTGDSENNPFKDSSGTIIPNSRLCDNIWHHCVVTGDGTTTKLYIDGVYVGSATTYKPLTGTQIYLSGWDSGTNYTFSGSCLSDFRIYATALSAEDILELYNSPINIDNKGNLYAYEFIEGDKNNFSKQGIAKNSEFIDLDTAGDSYTNASISSTVDYANIFIEK